MPSWFNDKSLVFDERRAGRYRFPDAMRTHASRSRKIQCYPPTIIHMNLIDLYDAPRDIELFSRNDLLGARGNALATDKYRW